MGEFFTRGETVVVDGGEHRWRIDRLTEQTAATSNGDADLFQIADLSDVEGNTRTVRADRLTKVGG